MLMTMRAYTEAIARRGLRHRGGASTTRTRIPTREARKRHQAFVDFMIPIVKGWSTEIAQEVTSLGVQVHGGMGFIEETGAAQHYRDARIITIYEGTTGIQANDLIGRKTARDGGAVARAVAAEIDKVAAKLASHSDPILNAIGLQLAASTADLQAAIDWLVPAFGAAHARRARGRGAVPQAVGHRRRRLADGPRGADRARPAGKRRRQRRLPARQDRHRALLRGVPAAAGVGLAHAVTHGGDSVLALPAEAF